MTTTTKQIITGLALVGAFATASQAGAQTLQLSYPTDATMTCEQINGEIARMDQLVGASNSAIASAGGTAKAANLGATVAVEAALRTGALGRMPGLGRFANMAASQAQASAAAKAERENQNIQLAQQRRAVMGGLYQGRGCNAPATAVPASMAATPVSTSVSAAPTALLASHDVSLRASAAPTAAIVGTVKTGAAVYPTGNRNGVWMEVDDENGARGWMSSAFAKPH